MTITTTPARPWEQLPVGTAADGHALVVTGAGVRTPSGAALTANPCDSVDKFVKLINWVTLGPKGVTAQVWVLDEIVDALGWDIDLDAIDAETSTEEREQALDMLAAAIAPAMAELAKDGWELRDDHTHWLNLSRTVHDEETKKDRTQMIDVILVPYAWTMRTSSNYLGILGRDDDDATALPEDSPADARELARRVAWTAQHLDVLPSHTGARTGATIHDAIRKARKRAKRGTVVTEAVPMPDEATPFAGDLEPEVHWARTATDDDLAGATRLVTIDQRASYLASAGMLSLGHGPLIELAGDDAAWAAHEHTVPFGLWRVMLPAGASLSLPDRLPLPHPLMHEDQVTQAWLTTESVKGLCAPISDGGAGMSIEDLEIDRAFVTEQQGRVLEAWAKKLRAARAVADETGDVPMKAFVRSCYTGYIGRMARAEMWNQKGSKRHHHQPLWRASIMAHCRWRGRRAAMNVADATGRWPIFANVDSWTYLAAAGDELVDPSTTALGRYRLEHDSPLNDDGAALLAASDASLVGRAIDAIHADSESGK